MKFYHGNLTLEVPDSVYYPREDSLLLAKALQDKNIGGRNALDMGCGSGFLAILMATKGAVATACDINGDAVKAAEENAAKNDVKIKAIKSDLFSGIDGKFDLIVFNPPYLPGGENEKAVKDKKIRIQWHGGKDGREVMERFISGAKNYLSKDGKILLLVSSINNEEKIKILLYDNGFAAKAIAREKIPWEELVVIEAIRL